MQETRHDGSTVLSAKVSEQAILDAVRDPRNKEVRVFKPGAMITKDDGSRWIVQFNGTLREARPDEQP